jgi:Type I site-specific restriction-modification system, R (restriction) subunit and related helicases
MPNQEPSELEWQTRKRLIDPRLEAQGWRVTRFREGTPLAAYERQAVAEYPTDNGPADYALCQGSQILGVAEAKKLSLGPQNVLTQAERYSRGLPANSFNFRGFHVPFLYSTNGEVLWFHDVRHDRSRSRKVSKFHTPNALREMLDRDFDADCAWFQANPNSHPRLRPYQTEASEAIERAIGERKRHMLLAMATGTGKTFTMVNEVYRLMKSGVGRRILFLVDRRVLAAQAVRAFASFEAEPGLKFDKIYEIYSQRFHREDLDPDELFDPNVLPAAYLLDPKRGHAFVYVCTIQRMAINLFGRGAVFSGDEEAADVDAGKLDIPIHAFDVVIADECHRGYTASELSVWRNTLEHFDAIKIGLTATPAAHTTSYFKDVVFRYGFDRAVREGHLVDYDAVAIQSAVRMNGIFIKEGEQVGHIDTTTGGEQLDLLEDERHIDTSEVEEKATAPDSNRKIIEEIKKYADEHEEKYGRFPKTLIFAVNDLPHTSHADALVDIARDAFGRGDSFVQKITGRVDRPLQRIREFRNRPQPGVVVSVDLMSTGVDIPDLEFIVLLRPVKSRILFEQMLGRGTRKGEKFPDKSHFTVFDCFDGTLLEYFKKATDITADMPERSVRTIAEIVEDIWNNRDRDYNIRCLVKRLQRIDKEMAGDAREMFAAYVSDGDLAAYARSLPELLRQDFAKTMVLLRDPGFQNLLVTYPRPKRVFLVAYETQDQVSSLWVARGADGRDRRPGEYLEAFARFVRENPAEIQAIRILLDRPRDWSAQALGELRQKLAATPERFTEDNLRRAHEIQFHKTLVDIISMVKHAAEKEQPLLTSEERVDRAIRKVTAGITFTPDQQRWLGRIRDHLLQNLSIDREDFENVPVFSREGGWRVADTAFRGGLKQFVDNMNEAIAA